MQGLKKVFNPVTLTISAGEIRGVDCEGQFFVLWAKTGFEDILMSVNNQSFGAMPVGGDIDLTHTQDFFTHIDFKNTSATAVTITFQTSYYKLGRNKDPELYYVGINSGIVAIEAALVEGCFPCALAADKVTYRRTVAITNIGANIVYVGNPVLDEEPDPTALGTPLLPNETFISECSGQIYVNGFAAAIGNELVVTIESTETETYIPELPC